jgi:hypothetical protein
VAVSSVGGVIRSASLQDKETKRRDKKRKKADDAEDFGPLFDTVAEAGDE